MKKNFKQCLKITLAYEGGYVNDPHDPGGETNKGITKAVYDAYRQGRSLDIRSVSLITDPEVQDIYKNQYWDRAHCDELPDGVDLAVFDYAVHSGVKRAVSDLQRGVGVNVDGVAGFGTVGAVLAVDPSSVVRDVCARRAAFLRGLRTWSRYGKGWGIRVANVEAQATSLANTTPVQPPALPETVPTTSGEKAPEKAQALLKTSEGSGLTVGGTGIAGQTVMQAADQVKPHINETFLGRLAIAAFVALMLIGAGLIAYSYIRRIKEKGGLGGFIGSIGQ